jgi:hypothetical protein
MAIKRKSGVQPDGSRRQDVEFAACIVFVDVLSLIHTHSGLIPKRSILWHVQKVFGLILKCSILWHIQSFRVSRQI